MRSIPLIILRHIVLLSLISQPVSNIATAEQRSYSVGVVPQFESSKMQMIWQPILDRLSRSSGISLQFKPSQSIPDFERRFTAGEFDFAYMNPYHMIVANEKQGYLPLLHDKSSRVAGVIVVRKDSPIMTVDDLDGKTVAFPAPNAIGAALLPRSEFKNKFKISVRERYVNTHTSVYLNVLLRQSDAGGGILKTLLQQPESIQRQLRILYKTAEIPPHPFVVHPRIDKNIQDRVIRAFLEMGDDQSGNRLISRIPIYKIGKTTMADYQELGKMGLAEFYLEN